MSSITDIISSNEALATRYESLTAVFTGATQGIGLGTLQAFVKHIPKPRAIIVGRNRERFEDQLKALTAINANGEFVFIEGELSLIKGVDAVCDKIEKTLEGTKIDLLFMSQGYAPLGGREYTSEGLDSCMVLVYYSRMRMTETFLDGQVLKPNASVIDILAGTFEGDIIEDDLALDRNYSVLRLRAQFASLTTLSLDGYSASHPDMAFLHIYPGKVKTGFIERSVKSTIMKMFARYLWEPIMFFNGITAQESGERMLWMALDEAHAKAVWSLGYDGSKTQSEQLTRYRQNNPPLLGRIRAHHQQVFSKANHAMATPR